MESHSFTAHLPPSFRGVCSVTLVIALLLNRMLPVADQFSDGLIVAVWFFHLIFYITYSVKR